MHTREVITIQVGRAGNAIGNSFWSVICDEHMIEHISGNFVGMQENEDLLANSAVFFNKSKQERFTPRTLCCDLNLDDMIQVLQSSKMFPLYSSRNIIGSNDGSGNCYARAFHTDGLSLAQQTMNTFRKEIERCDCLQGVRFLHSMAGGTGSGLSGLLMKSIYDYLDSGSKCILYSACIAPSPSHSNKVLEPYNTALILQDMIEYCHMVFPFDNDALNRVSCKSPTTMYLARCLSGITSSLRFPGLLNADLRKIHANAVPFKNAHFLTCSHSDSKKKSSILEITQNVMSPQYTTLTCDTQNEFTGSRYLASFLAYRGSTITASEVDHSLITMQKSGSRFDQYLPDWIPNSLSASICSQGTSPSVTCLANNTSIHEFFDRVTDSFRQQFRVNSHLYLYEQNGIHREEMVSVLYINSLSTPP